MKGRLIILTLIAVSLLAGGLPMAKAKEKLRPGELSASQIGANDRAEKVEKEKRDARAESVRKNRRTLPAEA